MRDLISWWDFLHNTFHSPNQCLLEKAFVTLISQNGKLRHAFFHLSVPLSVQASSSEPAISKRAWSSWLVSEQKSKIKNQKSKINQKSKKKNSKNQKIKKFKKIQKKIQKKNQKSKIKNQMSLSGGLKPPDVRRLFSQASHFVKSDDSSKYPFMIDVIQMDTLEDITRRIISSRTKLYTAWWWVTKTLVLFFCIALPTLTSVCRQ